MRWRAVKQSIYLSLLLVSFQLKAMAPEFYDHLPCHNSWVKVLYDFVMDPDISPYARIKRNPKKQLQNGNSVHHDYNTAKVQ